ncbi:Ankyrin repeat protein 2 [Giardia muris]|uniref:Ankyrin repeat protein 2 n=1 Tax=Giardia muris TaxID=5742 RepID=A0A4Z1T3W5_GIAMU|nr:Ankyrin repeat protein 2 [Giardia muris]|eukprot:TNJ27229.1 Ankyrin repeat protein 2 [Giardia muris]
MDEWVEAVEGCQLGRVLELRERWLGATWSDGQTALMKAVVMGEKELAGALLGAHGAFCYRQFSALMWAVYCGDAEMVALLSGEEAGLQNHWGATALMYAVLYERYALIPLLLEKEATLGLTRAFYGELPAHTMRLISHVPGKTALMLAAEAGLLPAVKLLFPAEADCRCERGWTAVEYAKASGQAEVLAWLLEARKERGGGEGDAPDVASFADSVAFPYEPNRGYGSLAYFCTPRTETIMNKDVADWTDDELAHLFDVACETKNKLFTAKLLLLLSTDQRHVEWALDVVEKSGRRDFRLLLFGLTTCGTASTLKRFLLDLVEPFFEATLLRGAKEAREAKELLDRVQTHLVELLCAPTSVFNETFVASVVAEAVGGDEQDTFEGGVCTICLSNQPDCVLLPCRHLACCAECVVELNRECPLCREKIASHVRLDEDPEGGEGGDDCGGADAMRELRRLDGEYARLLSTGG